MNKEQLYEALVALCQQVGFTSEHTYTCLHNAVDSIRTEEEHSEIPGC
jgi:hypothetical protein